MKGNNIFKKKDKAKEKIDNALQGYIKKGMWESAIDCLKQLSSMEPDNPTYHLRMGDYYLKLGAKEKTIEEYYVAASRFVDSGFIVKAIAIYKMILRIDPDDKDAYKKIEALHQHTQLQAGQETQKPETIEVAPATEFGTVDAAPVGKFEPIEVAPAAEFGTEDLAPVKEPETVEVSPTAKLEIERGSITNVIPLFANMTEDEFLRVVEKMVPLQFLPGEKIIEEGKVGDSIYIISKGKVKVISFLSGEEMELGELGPNEFFGEVSYLTGKPRTATIIATEETEVLELKGSELTEIISLHDWVKKRLEDYYGERVKKTIERIKNLKGHQNNL